MTDNTKVIYQGDGLHDDRWVVMCRVYGVPMAPGNSILLRFRWREVLPVTNPHRWWMFIDVWSNEDGWNRLWDKKLAEGDMNNVEDDLRDAMLITKKLLQAP